MKKVLRIALSLVLVLAAFVLTAYFFSHQSSYVWYASLTKPAIAPPLSVVEAIWVLVYILLAVALARLIGLEMTDLCKRTFFAFAAQVALNVLWLIFFFAFHAVFLSMITAIVLWFAVVILALNASQVDRVSFWLLLPYVAWITFATILSVEIWWWN